MNLETIELTNSGKVTEGVNMRSEWINDENMNHVLAAMMPANRLAIEVSMATGLRIGDVLQLTREQAEKGRFTVYEAKTGKRRPVRLPTAIQRRCMELAGPVYVFTARSNAKRHRTRQAVYKDVVRAAKAFRLYERVTPHSARKIYAVRQLDRTGDIAKVQAALNHDRPSTTMIYAMSRELTQSRHKIRARRR